MLGCHERTGNIHWYDTSHPLFLFHIPTFTFLTASFVVAIGNALQASAPPFYAFVVGFLFIGFGAAFLVSLAWG